jgi:ankyrin repeat protein
VALLSTPVTSGSRLCLHFAARYTDNVEVIKLLTEAYPPALLATSTDGLTPLNRAVYYRKDASIIQYLEQATQRQQNFDRLQKYNQQLRYTVLLACEKSTILCGRTTDDDSSSSEDTLVDESNESNALTRKLYRYCKEREMISLFGNVLSYVGVHNVPPL